MKKKICVVTGSRADYGLLKPLIIKIQNSKKLDLQFVVTGSHLSQDHGTTINEIKKDNIEIDELINIIDSQDSPLDISKYISRGISKFSESFSILKPDIIFILGDRYEIYAASISAFFLGIPIAHHSGGELTEGAFDDVIRHSITKMSNVHFVAALEYKKRIIQLGEHPNTIHVVGGFSIENIKTRKLLDQSELEKKLGISFNNKILIATFHPETMSLDDTTNNFQEMLKALNMHQDIFVIFTLPNADTYYQKFIKIINIYQKNKNNIKVFKSLGSDIYLSCLKYVDGVIGNSSSGITEVPSFKKGTINIGDRQKGRLRATSIIDCPPKKEKIDKAIRKLYSQDFIKNINKCVNPYDNGHTSELVIKKLETTNITTKKKFFDIDFKINT